jgi:N-ethylmaleimide reductase
MIDLFSPIDLLELTLPNRIFMSAMTRTRAGDDGVPTDLMRDYYVQRASAGLIVTECTEVSAQAHGVMRGPGIHRDDQIAGWRRITDAVHDTGGHIVCQIWHCGRISHPDIRGGELPVGPSAIAGEGKIFVPDGEVDLPVPRALSVEEIAPIVEDFAAATRAARTAGFDGVELHGANGYLQDQFLQDNSNQRTDGYGGSVANRARLMVETAEAMIAAWDREHVGIRLSPAITLYGMHDSDKRATFAHVIEALDALRPAYLCLLEPNEKDARTEQVKNVLETFRSRISVPVIGNTGFDKVGGNRAIKERSADAIAFGVPFLANPDLPERLNVDAPLNKPNPEKFYGEGPGGYTDYPALKEAGA